MAEATGLRNNALPYPVYGVPFGVEFPILDADGDLVTGATGLDSERSLNGDTFADCTNEATEIATSSGMYYLLLTAAEMTADVVAVIVKTSSSGAKTTVLTLYPRKLVSLRSGTAQGGAAGYITLDASAGAKDDIWNGCLVVATIDSNVEARIISDYTGSSKQAAVVPDWNVTPDSDDTFIVYLPEGRQINEANVTAAESAALTAATIPTAVQIRTEMDDNSTKLASIVADTNELQTDWVNGGRLDLILDARSSQTSVDTIDDFLDTEVAAIKAKTDNLPTDPADQSAVEAAITAATSPLATAANLATVAGYLDTEIAAILADTNELQTDWANGGRLDLLLDQALAAALLARQILGNKHTVQLNTPSAGLHTITVRNDDDTATVRTIVYNSATGARTVS